MMILKKDCRLFLFCKYYYYVVLFVIVILFVNFIVLEIGIFIDVL